MCGSVQCGTRQSVSIFHPAESDVCFLCLDTYSDSHSESSSWHSSAKITSVSCCWVGGYVEFYNTSSTINSSASIFPVLWQQQITLRRLRGAIMWTTCPGLSRLVQYSVAVRRVRMQMQPQQARSIERCTKSNWRQRSFDLVRVEVTVQNVVAECWIYASSLLWCR